MTKQEPIHIAIIPDGNRRWARKIQLAPWKGHQKSAETFRQLISFCQEDERVCALTIWVFSTENWKRSPEEVEKLMTMFEKYLIKEEQEFHDRQTKLVHSGRTDRLNPSLKQKLQDVQSATADYTNFTLNIALDYGGKDEIVRAVKKISDSSDVTQEEIQKHLDQPNLPDIDLVIRTSGEKRTSNFFLWQTSYSEWYFTDVLFPDFTVTELEKALSVYNERSRRFGS